MVKAPATSKAIRTYSYISKRQARDEGEAKGCRSNELQGKHTLKCCLRRIHFGSERANLLASNIPTSTGQVHEVVAVVSSSSSIRLATYYGENRTVPLFRTGGVKKGRRAFHLLRYFVE